MLDAALTFPIVRARPFRLILVEANHDNADYVRRVLAERCPSEFSIHCASTLASACDAIRLEKFDIMVLNVDLPDSRGEKTLNCIYSLAGTTLPIIVLSDEREINPCFSEQFNNNAIYLGNLRQGDGLFYHLLRLIIQKYQGSSNLYNLINSNPDSIVVIDHQGMVLFANPAAGELFGQSVNGLVNQQFGIPLGGHDAVEVNVSGNRVAEMRVAEITWHGQPAWLTSLRDITDRKRAEIELRDAKIAAEQASRAKSQFLGCMSHELRTPLNSVIGFADIILKDMMPDRDGVLREYADMIHSSGLHLLSLVNDILDVTSFEAGRVKLECDIFDLGKAVTSSLEMVSRQARERDIKLVYHPPPDKVHILADFRRVRQIIINIVANGVKFTRPGGAVTILHEVRSDGYLVMTIADNGVGILAEFLPNLMTPFTRVGDSYTNREEGSGLGLYISRVLVELHGGRLNIESEHGKGTRVNIILPPDRVID